MSVACWKVVGRIIIQWICFNLCIFDLVHLIRYIYIYIDKNDRNFKTWICFYWCCWWRVYDGSKMPHCPMLEVLTPDQSNLATQSVQSTPQYPNKQTRHSSHIIKYKRTSRTFQLKINIASSSGFSICTSELVGWVESLVAKKACNLSLRPPPPSQLQLSNPLPNSPGAPTHLGQFHGQLSWSTLAQCKVLKYDLSSSLSAEKRLFRSFRQMQVFGLLAPIFP